MMPLTILRALTRKYICLNNIQTASLNNVQTLKKLSNEQLTHRFLEYFQKSQNINKPLPFLPSDANNNVKLKVPYYTEMRAMDTKLCAHIDHMSNNDILRYLAYYVNVMPKKVTEFEFYTISESILSQRIDHLTPQELVQFMYLLALRKKNNKTQKIIRKCLLQFTNEQLDTLALEDILVICNATFKCSILISNKYFLSLLEDILYKNLHLLSDPAFFITIIKTFRHNECQNEELLSTITSTIFFNETYKCYNFAAICHILALYADYNFYDKELFKLFANIAMTALRTNQTASDIKTYISDNIRPKDIKRFLWIYSTVGHKLSKNDLELIENKILERFEYGHYDDDPDTLLDSVFYLWMLDYQATKLIPFCKKQVKIVRKNLSNSKIRVNMLLVCMQLENKQLYKEFKNKVEPFKFNVKRQINLRPNLMIVHDSVRRIMNEFDVNRLEFEFQIPHINIVGITGYKKNIYKAFVIDVMDDTTKLGNVEDEMTGMMQLKLRLLYKIGQTSIMIKSSQIEGLSLNEIDEYIRSKLAIVV